MLKLSHIFKSFFFFLALSGADVIKREAGREAREPEKGIK